MLWQPKLSTDLQRQVDTLAIKLLRANSELRLKQVYAQRLEHLLCTRNARIEELTAAIDLLRKRNQHLDLENHCLVGLLTAPPQLDATA
jgi:hypothetical protein